MKHSLADTLMRSKHVSIPQTTVPALIAQATKFRLSEGVAHLAGDIAERGLSSLVEARSRTRLPASVAWIEWPGTSRLYRPDPEPNMRADTYTPGASGVLLVSGRDLASGSATWGWMHADGRNETVCPLGAMLDFAVPADDDQPLDEDREREILAHAVQSGLRDEERDRLVAEMRRLNRCFNPGPSPLMTPFFATLDRARRAGRIRQADIDKLLRESVEDMTGEPVFLQSVLLAMGDPARTVIVPPDLEEAEATARRRRRLNRPAGSAFRQVELRN